MPLSFPSNPTLNQQFIGGGKTWIWDGERWIPRLGNVIVTVANTVPASTGHGSFWLDSDTGDLSMYVNGVWVGVTEYAGGSGSSNLLAVSSSIVPAANVTYDLGTASLRWRDLYLSGNSLILGGAAITSSGNSVVLPAGTTVQGGAAFGATGATGTAGTPGSAGAAGATGATGTAGAAGATGATGIQGNIGITPSLQTETLTVLTGSTGVVAHNYLTGGLWTHTGISANFTANFTNVPTTDNRVNNFTLILYQGATPYYPTAVQIDGVAQTILWFDGNTPTATANKTEIASFSLVRVSGAWRVLGNYSMYG